jgi:hypothetical protein
MGWIWQKKLLYGQCGSVATLLSHVVKVSGFGHLALGITWHTEKMCHKVSYGPSAPSHFLFTSCLVTVAAKISRLNVGQAEAEPVPKLVEKAELGPEPNKRRRMGAAAAVTAPAPSVLEAAWMFLGAGAFGPTTANCPPQVAHGTVAHGTWHGHVVCSAQEICGSHCHAAICDFRSRSS